MLWLRGRKHAPPGIFDILSFVCRQQHHKKKDSFHVFPPFNSSSSHITTCFCAFFLTLLILSKSCVFYFCLLCWCPGVFTGKTLLNSPWLRTAVVGIWKVKQTKCCVRRRCMSWDSGLIGVWLVKLTVAAGGALPALLTYAVERASVHHTGPSILTGTRKAAAVLCWRDKYGC